MRVNLSKTKASTEQTRQAELLNEIQKTQLMGAWEWDPKTGHYFWTDSMFFLHGLLPSSDNLISIEAANNMIHPQDIKLVQQKWQELEKTGSTDYFFRVILPEGKIKQLHARGSRVLTDVTNITFRGTYQEERGQIPDSLTDEIPRLEIQLGLLERAEETAQMGSWQINLSTFDTFIPIIFSGCTEFLRDH